MVEGMTLKTLKDIRTQMIGPPKSNPPHGEKGHTCCSYGADILELRHVAIKWIRKITKTGILMNDYVLSSEQEESVVKWIKNFFNINEEELE